MAPKVEVYTWRSCPFASAPKNLLRTLLEYLDGDETTYDHKCKGVRMGDALCLRFFINDQHIGGCDDDLYDGRTG